MTQTKGYAFIDIETTGFTDNDIIQFSAVIADENLKLKGFINRYLWTETEIEEGAENVHGISKDALRLLSKGRTFKDETGVILGILKDYTIVGHNIEGYDLPNIKKCFKKYLNYDLNLKTINTIDLQTRYMYLLNKKQHWGDSYRVRFPKNKEVVEYALARIEKTENYLNDVYKKQFGAEGKLHDALYDSYCCYFNFCILK